MHVMGRCKGVAGGSLLLQTTGLTSRITSETSRTTCVTSRITSESSRTTSVTSRITIVATGSLLLRTTVP